jgi:hypothetical protein
MARKYNDMAQHGTAVATAAAVAVAEQQERQPVFGIDPRLILVFETRGPIEPDEFRPAGLQVLDSSIRTAVVAFASDPDLTSFLERLRQYQEGVQEGRRTASFEHFYDTIETVRRYEAQDRITERLQLALAGVTPDSEVLVDIECWFPDQAGVAGGWLADVEFAAEDAGASIIDRYFNSAANVALLRISGPASVIRELAELDVIASVDLLPVPPIWTHQARAFGVDDLPDLPTPAADAPIVGLVDSGVRSAHPLLGGCIYDAVATGALGDGEDRSGHGTAIASLILRGPLEEALTASAPTTPVCQILSARVLDDTDRFPIGSIWAKELESAIRYCHSRGTRILNLSLGDDKTPFRGPRSTPVAAVLDELAKELSLVLVVCAGNSYIADYQHRCSDIVRDYPQALLDQSGFGILDPAPSALAITVGAIVSKTATSQADRVAIGEKGWPSPISRCGPGIEGAIKPEIVAPGGTMALERGTSVVEDAELECLVADGGGPVGSVVTSNCGTSLATPLVVRTAAAVQGRYPDASSNLIRALVLQAADPRVPTFLPEVPGVGADRKMARARRLIGFGEVRLDEAIRSQPNRAVLVAEDQIAIDSVHIYEVPIPSPFFDSGGERAITVSLAYDPNTRSRRLDYLDSRMKFEIVRGLDPETIERLFIESPDDMGDQSDDEVDDLLENGDAPTSESNRLSDLSSRQRPKMEPSATARSAGTNQLARKTFRRRLRLEDGQSFYLVVQNTGRWAPSGSLQDYAVAVTLEHSDEKIDLYAEVALELRTRVDQRVQLEAEVRP